MKHGTPLSAGGNWWGWGDTHLASLFGTQAYAQGADPARAAWSALFSPPEPFSIARVRASAGDLSPQDECEDRCAGIPGFGSRACLEECYKEKGIGVPPAVGSFRGLLGNINWGQAALYIAGVGLLLIGARELIQP